MAQSLDQMNIPPPGGPIDGAIKGGDPDQAEGGSSNLVRKEEWGSIADILKSIENTSKRSSRPVPSVGVPKRMPPLTENVQTSPLLGERGGQGMQQLDHLLRLMEQMCALRRQNNKLREHAQYLTAIKTLQDIRNEQLLHDCSCEVHRNLSDHSGSSSPMEHNHGNLESFSEPESHAGDDEMEHKYRSNRPERRVGRTISRDPKSRNMKKKRSKSLDPFGDEAEEETVKERGRPGIFSKFEKMKEKLTNRRGSVKRRSGVKGYDEDGKKYDSELGVPMDGVETKSEDSGFYQTAMDDSGLPMLHRFDLPQREEVEFSDGEPEVFDPRQLPLSQRAELRQTRKVSDVSTGSSSEDFNESKKKHKKYKSSSSQPPLPASGSSLSDHNEDVHRARRRSRFNKASSVHEFNSSLDTDPSPSKLPDPIPMPVRQHPRLEQSVSMDTEMLDVSGRLSSQSPQMGSVDSKLGQKRKHGHKKPLVDFLDPSLSSSPEMKGGDQAPRSSSPPEKKRSKETTKVVSGDAAAGKQAIPSTDMMTMYENIQANLSEDFLSKLEDWNKKKQKEGTDITKQSSVDSTSSEPPTVISANDLPAELLQGLSEEFSKKMADWDKKKKGAVGPSPKGDRRQKGGAKEKKESGTKEKKDGASKEKKEKSKKEDKSKKSEETPPPKKVVEGEKLAHSTRKVTVVANEEGLVKLEGASKDFEEKYREWKEMHPDGGEARRKEDDEGGISFSPPKSSYPLPAFRNISDSNSSLATPVIVEPNLIPRPKHEMASQAEFPEEGGGEQGQEGEPGGTGDEPISTLERRNSLLAEKLKRKNVNLKVVQSELLVVQEQLEKMAGWKGDEKRHSTCSSIGETALEEELIEIRSQVQELEEKIQSQVEEPEEGQDDEEEKESVDETAEVEVEEASVLPSELEAQVQTIQEEPLPEEKQQSVPTEDASSTTEALTKSLQQRENLIKFLSLEVERQRREINFLRSEGMGGAHFKRAKSFSARDRNFDSKAMQVMDIPMGKSLARRRKDSPNSTPSLSNADSSDQRNRESLSITTESTQSLETLHISAEDIRMEELGSQLTLDQDQRIEEEICLPEVIQEVSPDLTKDTASIVPVVSEEALPAPDVTQVESQDAEMRDAASSETAPLSSTKPMDVAPGEDAAISKPADGAKLESTKDSVPSKSREGFPTQTGDVTLPKVKDVPPSKVQDVPVPKSKEVPSSEMKDVSRSESKDLSTSKSREVPSKPEDVPDPLSKLKHVPPSASKDVPPSKSKDVSPLKSEVVPPSKPKDVPSSKQGTSSSESKESGVGISRPKDDTSPEPKVIPLQKSSDASITKKENVSASKPKDISTAAPGSIASTIKPKEGSAVKTVPSESKEVPSKPKVDAEEKKDTKKDNQPLLDESSNNTNKPLLGKQHPLDARIPSSIVAQKINSLREKTSSASDSDSKDERITTRRQRPEPKWKVKQQTAGTKKLIVADTKKSLVSDRTQKEDEESSRRSRPRTRQNVNAALKKTPPRDAKTEADLKETLSSMRGGLKKVQPVDKKPLVAKTTVATSTTSTAKTTTSPPKPTTSPPKLATSTPKPTSTAPSTISATKSWRDRKKAGDHAVESDPDSSIRSDTDSRRSFDPASSKRRDSSDSISSSRRSSPATRLIEKYDPKFAKNLAANRVEVSSVSDLKAKFSGGSKCEDEAGGLRGRKERPKAGSVKMLSQAFAVTSAVGTDSPGGAVGGKPPGGGTGHSSYRSTPSISPASSCGSLPGSQVSDRIKRMQERRTQSVKDSTSSKASTEPTKPGLANQVTLKPVPKIQEPLVPKNAGYRSSLPNLTSVRAKFEQPDSGSGNSGLRVRQKSGSTGKLSFTVSVTETKTTTKKTTEVKPVRARARSPRLVAVIETPGNGKDTTETVTVRLRSPSARRSPRMTSGSSNNSNKQVNELHISEPEISTVSQDTNPPPAEDMSASAPSLRTVSTAVKVTESKVTQKTQSSEQKTLSSSDPQIKNGEKTHKLKCEGDPASSVGRSQKVSDNSREVSRSEPAVDKASQSEETRNPKSMASPGETKSKTIVEGERERSRSSEKRVRSLRGKENIEQPDVKDDSSKTSKSESISESTEKSSSKSKSSREGRKSKGGKGKKGGGVSGNGGQQKSRKAKQHEPSTSLGSVSGKEGKAKGKRKGSKRREQETNSRNTMDTERHSQNNDSSGSRSSLDNYPDLLAETPRVRESVLIDDNGNKSRKNPRQAVAASALQGAAAAIGHALPDPATRAELDDLDERRSRKDKTRRGRMLSKADRLSKLDLFRRARSVDTSKASRDRSPSLERPGRSVRSSSMDRSKKRDTSPGKGKGKDGQRAGWKRILRASNESLSDSAEDDSLTSFSVGNTTMPAVVFNPHVSQQPQQQLVATDTCCVGTGGTVVGSSIFYC